MRPISELKTDFEMTRVLDDIIDVLKTAALIQFRSFQLKEKPNEDFLMEADGFFNLLLAKKIRHPYLFDRKGLPSLIVIITSDEGFLGELNTLLINAGLDQRKSEADAIIVLGERGARYLEDMKQKFLFLPGITDECSYGEARRLRDYLLREYRKKYGRVILVYPKFLSLTTRKITVERALPYQAARSGTAPYNSSVIPAKAGIQSSVIPAKAGIQTSGMDSRLRGNDNRNDVGAVSQTARLEDTWVTRELLVEPAVNEMVSGLIETWMGGLFLYVFWLSKQSEFGARIMHLEGSTQELSHLKQTLAFEYFRQLHTSRDKTIREISASKVLLGKEGELMPLPTAYDGRFEQYE